MKTVAALLFSALFIPGTNAQIGKDSLSRQIYPIEVSLFSESVSLGFVPLFTKPHPGVQVGTEFYYRRRTGSELFQSLHIGGYYHAKVHSAGFFGTEFGYRKYFGNFFLDIKAGLGYMLQYSYLYRYTETSPGVYTKSMPLAHRLTPSVNAGAGYRIRPGFSLFLRYGIFMEYPFNYKGIPVLPHETFHIGARFALK